jgi:N-acylglucosamine-6-phosphate 2-epimerase
MSILNDLRGGLIVSVQAKAGSAIDDPNVLAAMALAASQNGAVAVRMQGVANLRAARARVRVPIVGIIKREYPGYEPYITPSLEEVRAVVETGAEIVAFDATDRARPSGITVPELIAAIHSAGRLAMADCATLADARSAARAGADIVATTLAGYTPGTKGTPLPALGLVGELATLGTFTICEGGVARPEQLAAALAAGADAVVVGTAITNVDFLVGEFAKAAAKRR